MRARIALLWFLWATAITWREVKVTGKAPTPQAYLWGTVLYASAGVVSEFQPTFGFAIAAAWTVGVGYTLLESEPRSAASEEKAPSPGPRKLRAGEDLAESVPPKPNRRNAQRRKGRR